MGETTLAAAKQCSDLLGTATPWRPSGSRTSENSTPCALPSGAVGSGGSRGALGVRSPHRRSWSPSDGPRSAFLLLLATRRESANPWPNIPGHHHG